MSIVARFPYVEFTQNRTLDEAERVFTQRIADARVIYDRHWRSFVERACPVCESTRADAIAPFRDTYGVARCCACATLFVNPVPSLEALKDYYNNAECNRLLDVIYRERARRPSDPFKDGRVLKTIEYLQRLSVPDAAILEIGCGSGAFLARLHTAVDSGGSAVTVREYRGIDIDANAVAARIDPSLELTAGAVEEFAADHDAAYDVILHFELIEHLLDPPAFVRAARRLLKPGGVMIFTTPNANGLEMIASDYNAYRLLAHSIFPPMHLNAFSTANITHFAVTHGFDVLEIETPGALDVDMLAVARNHIADEGFRALAGLDLDVRALVQHLLVRCRASSHMQCVLRKPGQAA